MFYWHQYLTSDPIDGYAMTWAIAFLQLSVVFLVVGTMSLVLRIKRDRSAEGIRNVLKELLGRYLSFLLFCLLVPPRAGDFYANGGTDDLLFVYDPMALLLSLLPTSFSLSKKWKFAEAPLFFRALRRAGLAALWMCLIGGGSGYARESVRLWAGGVAVLFTLVSLLPALYNGRKHAI